MVDSGATEDCVGLMLRNKLVALISAEDFDLLSPIRWSYQRYIRASGDPNYYAVKKTDGERVYMHRMVLRLQSDDPREVDHVNGNGLDNRRCNLRIVSRSQNLANKRSIASASGFKGVQITRNGRYEAVCKGKRLGVFEVARDAAKAYDRAALKTFGEFAATNAVIARGPQCPTPTVIVQNYRERAPRRRPIPRDPTRLSARETEVVGLIASGFRVTEIATRLGLSVKSASTYKARALAKRALVPTA